MPVILLHPGTDNEQRVELLPGQNTIGRLPGSAVYVDDRSLSRRHACFQVDGEQVTVVDLGSKNGTWVSHRRTSRAPVKDGELVQCGDVLMRFLQASTSSEPPMAVLDPSRDVAAAPIHTLLAPSASRSSGSSSSALQVGDAAPEQRAIDKLRILLKVSQLLSSPGALDALLERILDLCMQILDVDRVSLLLADGAEPLTLRVFRTRLPGTSTDAYSRQIVEYVRARKVAALFSDASADPLLDGAVSIVRRSIRSSMCAPLQAKDRLLGVLYMDNLTTPDRFTEEDLEFATAFANQAAIAIDNAMLGSRLEREAVARSNLLRYFPPTTADRVMASGQDLGQVETEVTALFCDISGFTRLSARRRPSEVVDVLNAYFPAVANAVFAHDGTLEKYIGDALLAVWGAPFASEDDADRALRSAVDMQRAVTALAESTPSLADLRVHIGLDTGVVAAGPIGTDRYLQYATIGMATNLASRVCGEAVAGEVLVTEATRAQLRDTWELEPLGERLVRGYDTPLRLYKVLWDR